MSIQDIYYDILALLKKEKLAVGPFEYFAQWAFRMEVEADEMAARVEAYETILGIVHPEVRIGYKLLRKRRDGSYGPLFINRKQRVPVGRWLRAEAHRTKGFAYRPGWHILLSPEAPHLKKEPKNETRVWCRVAVSDFEEHERPENQGGKWLLAKNMIVLEEIG